MKLPQKEFPPNYIHKTNPLPNKYVSLPFQLVRCGFTNERHLSFESNYTDFVIFYVLEGVAQYTKYKDVRYINPETIIISNCNTKLSFSKATAGWKYFYVVFCGSHAKLYYNMIRDTQGIIPILPLHNIRGYFTDLCLMHYKEDIYVQMQACYLLHRIIHELIQVTRNINEARLLTPVQQTVVNTALKYIDEHYKEELTIDKICAKVSFSKYYFCKIFKEHTGMTLHQYLTEYRVNKSKEYLTYSKLPIHAVALEVGFKNTLNYSRSFKQYVKMTPSEYREAF